MFRWIAFTILIVYGFQNSQGQISLKLGTGKKAANYYKLGTSIDSILTNNSKNIKIQVLETAGSVDNIFRLENGEIDLAIVQNDVAFNAENGLAGFDQSSKLRGVMTFYHEPIFIVANESEIDLEKLSDLTVNIGLENSGLAANAKKILETIGQWDSVNKEYYHPNEVLEKMQNDKIQISFVNNITDVYKSSIETHKLFIIPLSSKWLNTLTTTYKYFTKYDKFEFEGKVLSTVAVKAMLVCRNDFDHKLLNQIINILFEQYDQLIIPNKYIEKNEVVANMPLKKWHRGANKFFRNRELIKSFVLFKVMLFLMYGLGFLIMLIIVANQIYFRRKKRNRFSKPKDSSFLRMITMSNRFIFRKTYIMIVLLLATTFMSIVLMVKHFEGNWAIENNRVAFLSNSSIGKSVLWLYVFGASGYDGNQFPQTSIGKILVTSIPLFGIGGILAIGGLMTKNYIKNKHMELTGNKAMKFKQHIIICGWNRNVPILVNCLLNEKVINQKPVVILGDCTDKKYIEDNILRNKMLCYVNGDARKKDDLIKAGFINADIAIIIADDNNSDFSPDSQSILKILAIEEYCKNLEDDGTRKNRKNIYTIAEIIDPINFELAKVANVDEIISFEHVKSKILSTSVHNPGASKLIKEILTFDGNNSIYNIYIRQKSQLIGKTFDEILHELRKENVLLLSINVENQRSKEEISAHKDKHNLERGLLTNPFKKEEIEYKLSEGDILIVLAQNGKVVESVEEMFS